MDACGTQTIERVAIEESKSKVETVRNLLLCLAAMVCVSDEALFLLTAYDQILQYDSNLKRTPYSDAVFASGTNPTAAEREDADARSLIFFLHSVDNPTADRCDDRHGRRRP